MARARPGGPSVSLFPFLAVLVCAMGALIFLLLVFTRQIRAAQHQVAPKPVVEKRPRPKPTPRKDPPRIVLRGDLLSPGNLLAQTEPPKPPVPKPLPKPVDPNIALRKQLDRLLAELRDANAKKKAAEQKLATARNNRQSVMRALEHAQRSQQSLQKKIDSQQKAWQALKKKHGDLQSTLAAIEQEIAIAKGKKAPQGGFQIVPYDGQRRTARRPIVIECTKREVKLLGESISFGPRDLIGYSRRDNPLLAAVKAIIRHEQLQNPRAPAAYPILIARPNGIVSWYLSRELLKELKSPFGYELLGENTPIESPKSSTGAIAAAKAAIKRVRKPAGASISGGPSVFSPKEFMVRDNKKPAFRRGHGGYLVLEKPKANSSAQPKANPSSPGPAGRSNGNAVAEPEAKDRVWGLPHRREGIGLERTVVLDITASQLIVDQIQKGRRGSDAAAFRWLEKAIDAQAKAWGRPPRGYFWVPRIRVRYRPGDAQIAGQIARGLKNLWNLDSDLKTIGGE